MKKETILITGICGFIGSHIADLALEQGYNVIGIDDLSTGSMDNIAHIRNRIKFFRQDVSLTLNDTWDKLIGQNIDYVIHQAARLSVLESKEQTRLYHNVNVTGTFNILTFAKKWNVKRVVFASSCAIQGESFYGLTKLINEQYGSYFTSIGLETVALRYQNVYGPRQSNGVIPKFCMALNKADPVIIYGDGEQTRDFIYVKDVAKANLLALKTPNIRGKYFDIAVGGVITINQLFGSMAPYYGPAVKLPNYHPRPEGEIVKVKLYSCQPELPWKQETPFRMGIKETIDYYKTRS